MTREDQIFLEELLTAKRLAESFKTEGRRSVWSNGRGRFNLTLYNLSTEQVQAVALKFNELVVQKFPTEMVAADPRKK